MDHLSLLKLIRLHLSTKYIIKCALAPPKVSSKQATNSDLLDKCQSKLASCDIAKAEINHKLQSSTEKIDFLQTDLGYKTEALHKANAQIFYLRKKISSL